MPALCGFHPQSAADQRSGLTIECDDSKSDSLSKLYGITIHLISCPQYNSRSRIELSHGYLLITLLRTDPRDHCPNCLNSPAAT